MQVLGIIQKVSLDWPSSIRSFLSAAASLSFSVTSLISLDCSFPFHHPDDDDAMPTSVLRTVVSVLIPFGLAIAALGVWLALWGRLRWKKAHPPPLRMYLDARLMTTWIVIVFYCYPGITNLLLSIYSCPQIDDGGAEQPYWQVLRAVGIFWAADANMKCFHGWHL